LAQNLAALRALATEGIQRGHMELHARQVAIAAGATGEIVEKVTRQLVTERRIRLDRAREILGQQADH
jgi:hydroxymethylglutaryl-CoA reductase